MTLALKIENFTKKYGSVTAVDHLNLQVQEGEIYGLLGPNGAGKSTTIGAISGINNFSEGEIYVYGYNVKTQPVEAKRRIGLSAQDYNVDPFLNLSKILNIVGGYYGLRKNERKERIEYLLETFNLKAHDKKPFMKLSGGMKRRAMIARALHC